MTAPAICNVQCTVHGCIMVLPSRQTNARANAAGRKRYGFWISVVLAGGCAIYYVNEMDTATLPLTSLSEQKDVEVVPSKSQPAQSENVTPSKSQPTQEKESQLSKEKEPQLPKVKESQISNEKESPPSNEKESLPSNEKEPTAAVSSASIPQSEPEPKLLTPTEPDVGHRVAGLVCDEYGGPAKEAAEEMVYWRDIPSDATYQSPFTKPEKGSDKESEELFFTFEPDEGGWNNVRMAMETAVALAVAMGRTLVLPPKMSIYLLWHGGSEEKNVIGFTDFYHVDSISKEHSPHGGLKVITFEQFLVEQAMTGKILDPTTGLPTFPPENRTNWNGNVVNHESAASGGGKLLWNWVRSVTTSLPWSYEECIVAMPAQPGKQAADGMDAYLRQVMEVDQEKGYGDWQQRRDSYNGHPTPVDAPPAERLAEIMADRRKLCVYNEKLQKAKVVHVLGEQKSGFRLLIHFYAFLFFEDWKQDVWIKRFIRDHFRYVDEIQCGAARVVEQVRKRARENGDADGRFDSFHIRRGDFQYEDIWLSADAIYADNTHLSVPDDRTVFVATDERNKTFFDPLRAHYKLLFLDDFLDQVKGISPNYYGMLDQLIASRGTVFNGAFYSTFTGYINRMRGYHAQKDKLPGYEQGLIESYYYVPSHLAPYRNIMREYGAVRPAFWSQEFHVSWRDLDHGLDVGNKQ